MAKIYYDLPDLRAFSELARTGGFNRAAESLAITPSALSRRISKLEAAVGGELVSRSTRGMALTSLGRQLLARVGPLLGSLDESVSEASRIARGLEGQVVIGCLSSATYSLIPKAITLFRSYHPDVRVLLRDGATPQVMASLQAQEVEFAVTTFEDKPAEFVAQNIARDPFVVICNSAHTLAKKRQITWQELSSVRLVGFRSFASSRRLLDTSLASHDLELIWFDEVDQLSSLIGYLGSGQFAGILPRMMAAYIPNAVVLPIHGFDIKRTIYLTRRKDMSLSNSAERLWQCIATVAGEQGRSVARPKRHKEH